MCLVMIADLLPKAFHLFMAKTLRLFLFKFQCFDDLLYYSCILSCATGKRGGPIWIIVIIGQVRILTTN